MQRIKALLFIVFVFYLGQIYAQDSVVTWHVSVTKTDSNRYALKFDGKIRNGWHVYSTASAADELTGITVAYNDPEVKLSELLVASASVQIDDKIFEKKLEVTKDSITLQQELIFTGTPLSAIKVTLNYFAGKDDNFIPEERSQTVTLDANVKTPAFNRILVSSIDLANPITDCGKSASPSVATTSGSLWNLFILGFLGGLIALLTPCVFPMIPLTVSFFTKKASTRKAGVKNAFFYGFFILLIYILLSIPFHFLDKLNPEILNNISTNVYLNVFFFVIFIFFAFSFFGYYEISLPSSFSGKADSKAGAGNIAGIFFMALT